MCFVQCTSLCVWTFGEHPIPSIFCGTKFGQQPFSKPNLHKLLQHSFCLTHQMNNAVHHILDIVLQVAFWTCKTHQHQELESNLGKLSSSHGRWIITSIGWLSEMGIDLPWLSGWFFRIHNCNSQTIKITNWFWYVNHCFLKHLREKKKKKVSSNQP
jgi:hypothetical protein